MLVDTERFNENPHSVPSVSSVCARLPTGKIKAIAADKIRAELSKLAPAAMASKIHPLLTKSYEPMWFSLFLRGGHLLALYKGKGIESQVGTHRDVLIADSVGEVIGRDLRSAAIPLMDKIANESQYGSGLNMGD